MNDASPALVDTDVWSRLYAGKTGSTPQIATWRKLLIGRPVLLAAQTRGELEYGARAAGWGARRLREYRAVLDHYAVLYPTPDIVQTWAQLRAECRQVGHALHEKNHMGDAWIAATARALRLPLLSGDALYHDAPGVQLLNGG